MEQTNSFFARVTVLIGERLALVILFFVGAIILFAQDIPQASADNQNLPSVVVANPTMAIPSPTPTPTPTPTPLPTATPTPSPTPVPADPNNDAIWNQIAACESNGHWSDDTGNGYYGGLQFNQGAWNSVGGSGNPAQASQAEQIMRAKMLQARRGWGAWGACASKLGLD